MAPVPDPDPDLLCSYWTGAGPVDPAGDRLASPWPIDERVAAAAEVGFSGIGIWHDDLAAILAEWSLAELAALLDDHGITHVELEFLDDWFVALGEPARDASDARRARFFEVAEALPVTDVKVGNLAGTEASLETLADGFAALSADAADHDVTVALELTSGDVNLDGLADALAVVEGVDGGGLLLDVWHLGVLGIGPADVAELPPDALVGFELNDGVADAPWDRLEATLHHRQLPGEGDFDVAGYVDAARSLGFDGPWGVEVLNREFRALPMAEAYRRAYEATVRFLE